MGINVWTVRIFRNLVIVQFVLRIDDVNMTIHVPLEINFCVDIDRGRSGMRCLTYVECRSFNVIKRRNTRSSTWRKCCCLKVVEYSSHVSTRQISRQSGISQSSVLWILHDYKMDSHCLYLHQELHWSDFQNRVQFAEWFLHQVNGMFF